MYKIIDESGITYTHYEYDGEAEFESMIIDNSETILPESRQVCGNETVWIIPY